MRLYVCASNTTQQWLIVISRVVCLVKTDSLYSDCYVNDIVTERGRREGGRREQKGSVDKRKGKERKRKWREGER